MQTLGILGGIAALLYFLSGTSSGRTETPVLQQVNRDRISSEAETWASEVSGIAAGVGVPPDLLLALVQQESGGDPDATGPGGEVGLTQLKQIAVDDVAENTPLPPVNVGQLDARSPQKNLNYGAQFLKLQRKRVRNSDQLDGWFDALRSYNCGFGGAMQSRACGSDYAQTVLDRAGRTTDRV